jgi:hypothetical protein
MRPFFSIALSACLLIACGKDDDSSHDAYECGGPSDVNLAGEKANLEAMQSMSDSSFTSSGTEPRNLEWRLLLAIDEGYLLEMDGQEYPLAFNSRHDDWSILSTGAEPTKLGFFAFFSRTVEYAVDENHCGTSGRRFEVKHKGQMETYEFANGIE